MSRGVPRSQICGNLKHVENTPVMFDSEPGLLGLMDCCLRLDSVELSP